MQHNTAQRQRSARRPIANRLNATWNGTTQHGITQKEQRHQWNKSGLSQNRPAVITESGGSSNWCQALFTCYFHIKWHFQGASSRASTYQCGIWGNWQQGHRVCSESPFVLFFSEAAALHQMTSLYRRQTYISSLENWTGDFLNDPWSALGHIKPILHNSAVQGLKGAIFKFCSCYMATVSTTVYSPV